MTPIARRIRALRLERGWSQDHLAELIGCGDHGPISRWERGICTPTIRWAIRLADAFGVSLDRLCRDG